MQGSDPAGTIAIAKFMLAPLRAGQGPAAQAAFDAIESFVDDYKKPKGPLKVTLNPPDKISATALSSAAAADNVIKSLGLHDSTARYGPHAAPTQPYHASAR